MALHLVGMMAFSELYSKQPSRRLPEGIDILLASLMVSQCVLCVWVWGWVWGGGCGGRGMRWRTESYWSSYCLSNHGSKIYINGAGSGQCSSSPWQHSCQPQHRSGCGSVGGSGRRAGAASLRMGQPSPLRLGLLVPPGHETALLVSPDCISYAVMVAGGGVAHHRVGLISVGSLTPPAQLFLPGATVTSHSCCCSCSDSHASPRVHVCASCSFSCFC